MSEIELTYEEWFAKYKPISNPSDSHGELMYFDHSNEEDLAVLKDTSPYNIWTSIDSEGVYYVTNGIRYINRLSYYITENPWVEGDDYFVPISKDVPCDCIDKETEEPNPDCEECESSGYKVVWYD